MTSAAAYSRSWRLSGRFSHNVSKALQVPDRCSVVGLQHEQALLAQAEVHREVQSRAEQSRAEQSRAEQGRAEQSRSRSRSRSRAGSQARPTHLGSLCSVSWTTALCGWWKLCSASSCSRPMRPSALPPSSPPAPRPPPTRASWERACATCVSSTGATRTPPHALLSLATSCEQAETDGGGRGVVSGMSESSRGWEGGRREKGVGSDGELGHDDYDVTGRLLKGGCCKASASATPKPGMNCQQAAAVHPTSSLRSRGTPVCGVHVAGTKHNAGIQCSMDSARGPH